MARLLYKLSQSFLPHVLRVKYTTVEIKNCPDWSFGSSSRLRSRGFLLCEGPKALPRSRASTHIRTPIRTNARRSRPSIIRQKIDAWLGKAKVRSRKAEDYSSIGRSISRVSRSHARGTRNSISTGCGIGQLRSLTLLSFAEAKAARCQDYLMRRDYPHGKSQLTA